jgi:hypothetical protein
MQAAAGSSEVTGGVCIRPVIPFIFKAHACTHDPFNDIPVGLVTMILATIRIQATLKDRLGGDIDMEHLSRYFSNCGEGGKIFRQFRYRIQNNGAGIIHIRQRPSTVASIVGLTILRICHTRIDDMTGRPAVAIRHGEVIAGIHGNDDIFRFVAKRCNFICIRPKELLEIWRFHINAISFEAITQESRCFCTGPDSIKEKVFYMGSGAEGDRRRFRIDVAFREKT